MSDATGASTDWLTVIGRGSPSDERRLMAGSLSATLSGLDLLDVRVDGIEVMRRLCVRVRDTNWGTIAPATSDVAVEETGAGFAVTFNAHHVSKEIDFAWSGRVSGDARGSLEFAMEGEARAKCTFFRIGLIVLHPTNLAVASSIVAARDGDRRSLTAPRLVAPVEIVDGLEAPLIAAFNQLSLRWSDGLATTFAFAGDLFEMEDQRNWGDGSFKTFSTPLSVPLPLRLQRGDRLRQALSFGWTAPRSATAAAAATAVIVVTVGEPLGQRLPSTGLSIDADRHMPTTDEAALLRSIRPAHLRGEIDLSDKREAISDIRRCKQIADSINAPLELACIVPAPLADLTGMLRAIEAELAISATRVALLPANGSVTPLEWLNQLPAVFGSSPDATVGTCSDFVELNRRRPPASFAGRLVYAASPQVHDNDEVAIIQSLEGQDAAVETARAFAPAARIDVAPITLKPWRPSERSAPTDERQGTLFAAAWLMGSVLSLGSAGADSLTYFECTGERGVLLRQDRDGAPTALPTLHVLSYLGESSRAPLVSCASSDRTKIGAYCVRRGGGLETILTNLTAQPQAVRIAGLPPGTYRSRILTAAGFADSAAVSPEANSLELPPYAVAIVKAATR